MRAAATGKARSPTVDSRVRRIGSDVVDADIRRVLIPRSVGWLSSSARFVGAVPFAIVSIELNIFTCLCIQRNSHETMLLHRLYTFPGKCTSVPSPVCNASKRMQKIRDFILFYFWPQRKIFKYYTDCRACRESCNM